MKFGDFKRHVVCFLLAASVLYSSGCYASENTSAILSERFWHIENFSDGAILRKTSITSIPKAFSGNRLILRNLRIPYVGFLHDGRISGDSGCGNFIGNYKLSGKNMSFFASTILAGVCSSSDEQQSGSILKVFNSVHSIDISKNRVLLEDEHGAVKMTLTAIDGQYDRVKQ